MQIFQMKLDMTISNKVKISNKFHFTTDLIYIEL